MKITKLINVKWENKRKLKQKQNPMPKELYVSLHFTLLGEHAAQSCSFDDSEMRRCREEKTGHCL